MVPAWYQTGTRLVPAGTMEAGRTLEDVIGGQIKVWYGKKPITYHRESSWVGFRPLNRPQSTWNHVKPVKPLVGDSPSRDTPGRVRKNFFLFVSRPEDMLQRVREAWALRVIMSQSLISRTHHRVTTYHDDGLTVIVSYLSFTSKRESGPCCTRSGPSRDACRWFTDGFRTQNERNSLNQVILSKFWKFLENLTIPMTTRLPGKNDLWGPRILMEMSSTIRFKKEHPLSQILCDF